MPKEIISVQAEDGSLHPDMLSAVRHETTTFLRTNFPELKSLLDSVRFNNLCIAVRDYANMLHELPPVTIDTTREPEPPGDTTLEDAKLADLCALRRHAVDQMRAKPNRRLARDFLSHWGWRDEDHFGQRASASSVEEWSRVISGRTVSHTPIPPSNEPRWMGCGGIGQAKISEDRFDKVDTGRFQPQIDRAAHD